ncbi:F-box protein At3g07870-like [Papaver somniferum]|uniref:F-box protein At3g07870-like n=1 Tax=Papaver somniferum TaxID=3469 RepID=UPI000E70308F|nr:F-box protein At3g07870-like [Papaver somniferum]
MGWTLKPKQGIERNDIAFGEGTDSWRCSKTVLAGSPVKLFNGVLVDGDLHWLNKKLDKIISLDISDEKFKQLQMPKEVLEKKNSSITMGDFEGCLALVVDYGVAFDVGVMQEYGVSESWTKRYFINDEKIRNISSIRLMCSLKNGAHLVLLADYKVVVYDPIKHWRTSELRMPYNTSINFDGNAVSYFERLVSLNSGTYAGRKKKKIKFKINPFKIFCT